MPDWDTSLSTLNHSPMMRNVMWFSLLMVVLRKSHLSAIKVKGTCNFE